MNCMMRIRHALADGPLSTLQIDAALPLDITTIRKKLNVMRGLGQVHVVGQEQQANGQKVNVWALVDMGRPIKVYRKGEQLAMEGHCPVIEKYTREGL